MLTERTEKNQQIKAENPQPRQAYVKNNNNPSDHNNNNIIAPANGKNTNNTTDHNHNNIIEPHKRKEYQQHHRSQQQ